MAMRVPVTRVPGGYTCVWWVRVWTLNTMRVPGYPLGKPQVPGTTVPAGTLLLLHAVSSVPCDNFIHPLLSYLLCSCLLHRLYRICLETHQTVSLLCYQTQPYSSTHSVNSEPHLSLCPLCSIRSNCLLHQVTYLFGLLVALTSHALVYSLIYFHLF